MLLQKQGLHLIHSDRNDELRCEGNQLYRDVAECAMDGEEVHQWR